MIPGLLRGYNTRTTSSLTLTTGQAGSHAFISCTGQFEGYSSLSKIYNERRKHRAECDPKSRDKLVRAKRVVTIVPCSQPIEIVRSRSLHLDIWLSCLRMPRRRHYGNHAELHRAVRIETSSIRIQDAGRVLFEDGKAIDPGMTLACITPAS
ncbi:hypothetical protein AC579_8998 [Pseudocercospora musae]|uniref:Uncharacterized protein n=1 Tax=Pseudocercospora musae TaxID=113226 RepID=A0A139I842_9PEZI|nr:hypothetical protein AC579_8998 [Pseudocercospora musae]